MAVTFINAFKLDPRQVDSFMTGWEERAAFMIKHPGFRSLRLHRAITKDVPFQIVNVAEWDSADALRAATAQPIFMESVQRSMDEFDVSGHPGIYRVTLAVTAD
jgi:heme-degrading monooxygenase HmoA